VSLLCFVHFPNRLWFSFRSPDDIFWFPFNNKKQVIYLLYFTISSSRHKIQKFFQRNLTADQQIEIDSNLSKRHKIITNWNHFEIDPSPKVKNSTNNLPCWNPFKNTHTRRLLLIRRGEERDGAHVIIHQGISKRGRERTLIVFCLVMCVRLHYLTRAMARVL
jgi:Cft2 family RNA processing exonuclease